MNLLLTTIAAVVLVGCGKPVADIDIHTAAKEGNIEAVEYHLGAGVDVNAKNDNWPGETPLHHAGFAGQNKIVELLIINGADVMAKDQDAMTPLHAAAYMEVMWKLSN